MTPPLIITGMHRSGTSLLASMFGLAGLHLGEDLLGPASANRRGYFEDVEFIEFHESLLARCGTSMYLDQTPGPIPDESRAAAEAMLAARRHRACWGWKDPRTTIFLDMWRDLEPAARFVFVYRKPAEVLDSLRRRRDRHLQRRYPGAAFLERLGAPRFRAGAALMMWRAYNERVVDFLDRHGDRCSVVSMDLLASSVPEVIAALAADGFALDPNVDLTQLIDPELGSTPPHPALERRCAGDGAARAILDRLDAHASANAS